MRIRTRSTFWALPAAALISFGAAAAQPASASAASSTTTLANWLPGLSHAARAGAADPASQLRIDVSLAHPDPAGEAAAYRAIYDRSNPAYHHFLTPAQYQARFGVSSATAQAASSWLSSQGINVFATSASNDLLEAQGSVGQLEHAFGITISRFSLSDGTAFVANDNAPTVPSDLDITNVMGLNTLQRYQTPLQQQHQSLQRSQATPSAAHPASDCTLSSSSFDPTGAAPGICVGGYTPQAYWSLYDMPATDTGQGQHIGVFMEGQTDSVVSDLRTAEIHNGLSEVPVRVEPAPQPGAASAPTDNSGAGEWDLDTQSSTGVAPNVSDLTLYDANSLTDPDVTAEFSQWANDSAPGTPSEMNASFGECETTPANGVFTNPAAQPNGPVYNGLGDNVEPTTEAVLLQATLEGRTLFTSAGDTGGSCPALYVAVVGAGNGIGNEVDPAQNYPCASQFAVCVGGTVLYGNVDSNGNATTRNTEYAWTHTGGGNAAFMAQPSFQQKYLPTGNPPYANPAVCAVKYDGTLYPAGTICRMTPDIAAQSGDVLTNGFAVTFFGMSSQTGGTSLSSPLSMGMWARINAAAPTTAGFGFADETIYPVASSTPGAMYDVTTGSNVQQHAGAGYDETTGWGVFDVKNFIAAANPANTGFVPVNNATQAAVPAPPTGNSVACEPLYISYAGNATEPVTNVNAPSLDIIQGSIGYTAATSSLQVEMQGPSGFAPAASSATPGGAEGTLYITDWSYKGAEYMAGAYVDPTATTVSYFDGPAGEPLVVPTSSDPTGATYSLDGVNATTGTFSNSILTVNVPLTDVGSPKVGDVLQYPMGISQEVNDPALVPFTIDTGGAQNDYTVGQSCNGSTSAVLTGVPQTVLPESPVAPALLVVGGLAGAAAWRRRRRATRVA